MSLKELLTGLQQILKMLNDRGYDVDYHKIISEYSDSDFLEYRSWLMNYVDTLSPAAVTNNLYSYLKFREKTSFYSFLSFIYSHTTQTIINREGNVVSKKILIYFVGGDDRKKISKSEIDIISSIVYQFNCSEIIIVGNNDLSPEAKKNFLVFRNTGTYYPQFYLLSDLQYDPTDHIFGCAYNLLTPEESQQLLIDNNLSAHQIPPMCLDGPIAKYYGARPHQIFECYRRSLVPGSIDSDSISYRMVSNKLIGQ